MKNRQVEVGDDDKVATVVAYLYLGSHTRYCIQISHAQCGTAISHTQYCIHNILRGERAFQIGTTDIVQFAYSLR